jgi:serine/threonine-protein kinase
MAPEQLLDFRGVRPAADLYSMGVVLYRLLTGAFPLDIPPGANPLTAVLEEPIVPVRRRQPTLAVALAEAVERALMKSPGHRFASAGEMRRAIVAAV